VPAAILPLSISLSKGGLVKTATSTGSPALTRSATFATVPYSMRTLWPEECSKGGINSCSAARIAPPAKTFNSAASIEQIGSNVSSIAAAADRAGILSNGASYQLRLLGCERRRSSASRAIAAGA
jgi:hypothetical protein